MDFELDTANGILHIKSEAFNYDSFAIDMINNTFFGYLKEFFLGKHFKSMAEFINNWNNIKDEFRLFMNLRYLGYALSV